MDTLSSEYARNPEDYFSGARKLFIDDLPVNSQARLLEIGCGNGETASYAIKTGKSGWCAGVELCAGPADKASHRLHDVQVGDVETIDLPYPPEYFDVLIMSEVIEHFRDPWATLRRLHPLLKVGALVGAGSPNVAHRSIIKMMLLGRWDYVSKGILDKTHLRWFTPATYRELFEDCGFQVMWCGPAAPLGRKDRWLNFVTGRRIEYLLTPQLYLKATRL